MRNEPAIDVVTDERIKPGITVAHRRTATAYNPKADNWPSTRWPACIERAPGTRDDGWVQYGASHAGLLGAVPCPERACFNEST